MSIMKRLITTLCLGLALSLCPSRAADASNGYYTVQLATYSPNKEFLAVNYYEKLKVTLDKDLITDLRIDKSRKYLIIRLGRFRHLQKAINIWRKVRSEVKDAILLKVVHPERYRQIYPLKEVEEERPLAERPGEETHEDETLHTSDRYYTIHIGNFLSREDAEDELQRLKRHLSEEELKELVLEKTGQYFSLRLGRFKTYQEARDYLRSRNEYLTGVIVVVTDRERESPYEPDKATPPVQGGNTLTAGTLLKEVDSLIAEGHYGRAAQVLRDAISNSPSDPELHARYGEVLLRMGFSDRALQQYKKAVELAPDVAEFHTGMGYSLLNSHIDRAKDSIRAFKRALEIEPEDVNALEGLGIVYVSINRTDLAMEIYNRLKELDPEAADRLYSVIINGIDWGSE